MIKHIIMWKIIATTEHSADENLNDLKKRLDTLKDSIPVIVELETGINEIPSERAADLVLYTCFENWTDFHAYRENPQHKTIIAYARPFIAGRMSVDYEVE